MLRNVAEELKKYIEEDSVLHDDGHVSVVVEDKADVSYEIANAIAQTGVCVLIAITGFRRVQQSPIPQGMLQIQFVCYENPSLNRDDLSILTAQGVSERLVKILHYQKFPFLLGQMIFQDFSRDDAEEANIVRGNYEVCTTLDFADEYYASLANTTSNN